MGGPCAQRLVLWGGGPVRNALCHGGGPAHNALCHRVLGGLRVLRRRSDKACKDNAPSKWQQGPIAEGGGLSRGRVCAQRIASRGGLVRDALCPGGGPVRNALCHRAGGRVQRLVSPERLVHNALCRGVCLWLSG